MTEATKVRRIEVVPYDPKWKELYGIEAEKLKAVFEDVYLSIHHIGSTAVPGLSAKPVIDIMVVVEDIEAIDGYNAAMEALGYIPLGANGIEGRRFFIKGEFDRTHHVHVFQLGNREITKHLHFRDYLTTHESDLRRYEALKQELAKAFPTDPEGYSAGKNELIQALDRAAAEWALALKKKAEAHYTWDKIADFEG